MILPRASIALVVLSFAACGGAKAEAPPLLELPADAVATAPPPATPPTAASIERPSPDASATASALRPISDVPPAETYRPPNLTMGGNVGGDACANGLACLGAGSGPRPAFQVTITEVSAKGVGSITASDVSSALQPKLAAFRTCYQKALASNASLAGRLELKLVLLDTGAVGGTVREPGSTLKDEPLFRCIADVTNTLRFASPPTNQAPILRSGVSRARGPSNARASRGARRSRPS